MTYGKIVPGRLAPNEAVIHRKFIRHLLCDSEIQRVTPPTRRASSGIVSPHPLAAIASMKNTYRVVAAMAAGLAGLTSPLHAQEINFQGSAQGCLYAAWETGCTPSGSSSELFLTYLGSTFHVGTVDGMAGIGSAPGSPNVNNLGSFFLTGDPSSYTGSHFLLDVVFSTPTILNSPSVFRSALRGSVTANANGLVGIKFDSGSQVYDYTSGDQTGNFTLSVNNVSLTPGSTPVALTGEIDRGLTITATPEPSSMVLMATGFAGLVGFARKRRRST
jgi:hypothetical protein